MKNRIIRLVLTTFFTILVIILPMVLKNMNNNKIQNSNLNDGIIDEVKTDVYADGKYVSDYEDEHGLLTLEVLIENGIIKNIKAINIPDKNQTTKNIVKKAIPHYIRSVLEKQNENIDELSYATESYKAFRKAFGGALNKAIEAKIRGKQ